MSLRAIHEGLKVVEFPIPYHERVGRSKLSVIKDGLRYLQSIVWTALGYNPVRVLGGLGLVGVLIAALVAIGLFAARLNNITTLGLWGTGAIFLALVAGVAGVSLFNLGATFNYLIGLFRKKPVREGLFGKPLFDPPLDRHFGWVGILSVVSRNYPDCFHTGMGLNGWGINRLWLYLVGGSMLELVGLQFFISWILIRKLEELSEREIMAQKDLDCSEIDRIG